MELKILNIVSDNNRLHLLFRLSDHLFITLHVSGEGIVCKHSCMCVCECVFVGV